MKIDKSYRKWCLIFHHQVLVHKQIQLQYARSSVKEYIPFNIERDCCLSGRGNVSQAARLCSSSLVHPVCTDKTCMLNTLTSLTSSRSIHFVTIGSAAKTPRDARQIMEDLPTAVCGSSCKYNKNLMPRLRCIGISLNNKPCKLVVSVLVDVAFLDNFISRLYISGQVYLFRTQEMGLLPSRQYRPAKCLGPLYLRCLGTLSEYASLRVS